MLSRPLQAAVPSITSSSRPANAVSLRHRPATRCTSARRGATFQIPLTNWVIGGGSRKPPGQGKPVGAADGPDGPEGQSAAQRLREAVRAVKRWAAALDVNVATLAAVVTLLTWNSNLATTAVVTESEGRTKERVEGVQRSVTESEGRTKERVEGVQKSVTESEGRTKERVEGVLKSVEGLRAEMRDSQKWGVTWQHVGVAVVTAVFMKFFN